MKTYQIEQKISNTGSIHDIASDNYDRNIKFRAGCIFAVVLSSYYGDIYTTHQSEWSAIKKSKQLSKDGWSHCIIDADGNAYTIVDGYWSDQLKILY